MIITGPRVSYQPLLCVSDSAWELSRAVYVHLEHSLQDGAAWRERVRMAAAVPHELLVSRADVYSRVVIVHDGV